MLEPQDTRARVERPGNLLADGREDLAGLYVKCNQHRHTPQGRLLLSELSQRLSRLCICDRGCDQFGEICGTLRCFRRGFPGLPPPRGHHAPRLVVYQDRRSHGAAHAEFAGERRDWTIGIVVVDGGWLGAVLHDGGEVIAIEDRLRAQLRQ